MEEEVKIDGQSQDPPYRKKVYDLLKSNYSDFNRSEEDFYKRLDTDTSYAGKVHELLAKDFSDFKRGRDEFVSMISQGVEKKNPIASPLQTGASPSSGVPLRDVAQPTPAQKIAPSVAGGLNPPGPEMKQIIPAPMEGDMQRPVSGSQESIDSIRKAIGNAKQAADGEITQELYKINDKPVSRERMRDSLHDTDFMRDVVSGKINVNIQDDEELGQLLRSQVDAGGKASDLWDSLKGAGYRMAAGVVEFQPMVNRVMNETINRLIPGADMSLDPYSSAQERGANDLMKKAEESEKKVFQYRENFANSLANGDFSDAGYQLLNTVSGSVPYTASAAVLGYIGGPGLAFSVLAPIGSGSELASMNISEDEAIKGLSEAEKLTRAMAFGTLEAGADVVAGRAIGRAFDMRKYLLRDAIKQTGSEMGEGAAKQLAKETAYRNVKEFGKQIGMQALEEGVAEGGTTIGQMMTDDLLGVKDYKASDYLRDVSNAAMLGAFSGAGMTAGAGAVVSAPQVGIGVKRYYDNVLSSKDGKKNIKARVDSMEESGSITKEQAESVMSSVESREKAVSAVPSDQRSNTEVVDLVQEKQAIKEQEAAADDIFKPEYSKKIEELDSKIAELSGRSVEKAKEEPKQQNENAVQERRTASVGEHPVGKEGTRNQEGAGVQQGEQGKEPSGEGKAQEEVDQGPGDVESIADRIRAAKKSPKTQVSEQGFELITEEQHKRLTDRLAKAFGNKVRIVEKEEFNKAASEAGTETISDTNGTVYGAVLPDGTMYIDRSRLNANTPIHEHTHLFNNLVRKNNKALWKSIVNAVKQTKEWRDVTRDKAYSHLEGDDAIADEAFSRLVGNMGEGKWEDVIRRADNKSLYRSIRDLAKKYFDYILSALGVDVYNGMSADGLASMALDQLLGGGNIDTAFNRVSDSLNKLFALAYGKDSILANTKFQATPVANTSDRRALEKALGERDGRAVYSAFGNVDDVQHLIAWIKKKFPIKGSAAYILNKDVTDEDGNTTNFGKGVVFKEYMASLKEDQSVKETKTSARPDDLLNQVGYSFTQTKSDEEASRQFRAYYKDGELICTIGSGGRHRGSIVTFIVRDDAKETPHARDLTQDNLTERWKEYLTQKGRKNEDGTFNLNGLSPSSRDPYSTSVVSLQISKENGARKEISRYNHTLSSPDNIFDRNFDNVVNGLDDAMYSYFGIDKNTKQTKAKLPSNVVVDAQGNYYVYSGEEDGVYWGDGYYLENGTATILDRGSERMVDGWVVNANGNIRYVGRHDIKFSKYGGVKKVNYIKGNDISITTDKGTFVFETKNGSISILKEYDKGVLLELMSLNGIESELNDGKYTIKNNYVASYGAFLWNNDIVSIGGYADFGDSQLTTLGSLQSIGGYADFGDSQLTTLGSLQSIGRYAYFGGSQITTLGSLQSIGGYAYFGGSQLTTLGSLQSIGGNADFSRSQLTTLGSLQSIGGDANFSRSQLTTLGSLQSIGGDAYFSGSQLTTLGSLQSIGGDAYFSGSQLTTLGSLQSIGRDAYFSGSQLTTLGSLQSIGGYANFRDSQVNQKDIDRINSSSKALSVEIKEIFKDAHNKFSEAIVNGDDVSFDDFLPDEYRSDKKKLQPIADFIRKGKLGEGGAAFSHTPLSLAWNAALEAAALSVEAAATVAEAIDAALQSFRKSDWYKGASKRSRRKKERNLREQLLGGMSMSDIRAAQKEAMANKHYTKAPIVRVFSKIRPGDIPFSVLEDYIGALKGLSASVPNYDGLTVLMGRVVDAVEKGKASKANAKKAKAEEMAKDKDSVRNLLDEVDSADKDSIEDLEKSISDLSKIISALESIEFDENGDPVDFKTSLTEDEIDVLITEASAMLEGVNDKHASAVEDLSESIAENILDIMSEVSAAGQHRRWSQPQQDLYYDLFSLLHQRGADAKAMLKKLPLSQLATLEALVSNMMPITVNNGANMTSSGEVDVARLSPIVDRLYSVSKDADAFVDDAKKIAKDNSKDTISSFASNASAHEVQRQKDLLGIKITERSKFLETLTQLYETGMTAYNEELRAGLDHITKAKKAFGIKQNSQRRKIGVIAIYIRDYLDGKATQGGKTRDYWREMMYETDSDGNIVRDASGNPVINMENLDNMDEVRGLADLISASKAAVGRRISRSEAVSLAALKVVNDVESAISSMSSDLKVDGDPDGNIDPKKVWESYAANDGKALTKEERAFLESIVSYSESHLGYMQEAANEARGLPFKWIPFYVRRTVKRGSAGNVSANPKATARRGTIRLVSSTGKEAVDMKATPVEYDIEKMFTHALEQTARDYHVGKSVRRINSLLQRLSMSDSQNERLLSKKAAEYMSQMLTREFIRNVSPIDRAIGSLVKLQVMNTMANAVRTIREHAIAGTTLFLRTGRPIATVRAQIASKEKKGELLDLMHFLGSPLILKAITNKHMDMAGSEIRNPTLAEEYLRLSAASSEPMIVRSTWFPEFKDAFKKETGEDFDMSKFNNDPEYRYEHRSEMLSASTTANLAVYSIIGPALSGQRVLNAQLIPFIGASGRFSTQSPMVKQIMLFTGFSNRERQQLVNGLVGAAEGLASGNPETFAREASKTVGTAISVLAYGITGTMQFILSGYVLSALFGDDDEKEKWAKEWRDFTSGKSAFDEVIRATAGLALSKYGAVSRGMATIAASILYNSTDDKEMKEYIRKSMKDNLYSEPISMSSNKYSSEPTIVELIGEMMASARAIARMVDMGSKFVSSVGELIEGEEDKPVEEQTLADRQDEKDAIDAVNVAYSAAVLALTVNGMPMLERATFDKIIDRLNKHPLTQKDIDDKNAVYNKMLFSEIEDSIEKESPSQRDAGMDMMRNAGKDMPKNIEGGDRYGNDIIRKDDPRLQEIISDAVKKYRPSSSNKIILSDYELSEDSGDMVAKNVENMRVRLNAKRLGYVGGDEGAMSEDPVAYTDLLSTGKGGSKGMDGVVESLIPSSKSWTYKEQNGIYRLMLGMKDAGILSKEVKLGDFREALDKRRKFIDEMEKRIAKKK